MFRRRIAIGLASLGLVAGGALATVSASPASAATTYQITLHVDSRFGIVTHGTGNQVTVQLNGHTLFYKTATSDGFTKLHVNGGSNCLEALNSNIVVVNPCSAGNDQQKWHITPASPACNYQVKSNNNFMAVASASDGQGVVMNAGQGDIRWDCGP
jgi:hypothetical protein